MSAGTATTPRPRYLYRVVSHCGAGVLGKDTTLAEAREYLTTLVGTEHHETVEVERVQHLPNGSSRYWLWRGGRWIPWGTGRTHDPSAKDLAHWRKATASLRQIARANGRSTDA